MAVRGGFGMAVRRGLAMTVRGGLEWQTGQYEVGLALTDGRRLMMLGCKSFSSASRIAKSVQSRGCRGGLAMDAKSPQRLGNGSVLRWVEPTRR